MSPISLAAQWTDEDFSTRTHTILGCQLGPSEKFSPRQRDKAKNMIKALDGAGLCSLPCIAHTLQPAWNEGRLAQKSVAHAETVLAQKLFQCLFKHQAVRFGTISGADLRSELLILCLRCDPCCQCAAETHRNFG